MANRKERCRTNRAILVSLVGFEGTKNRIAPFLTGSS